MMQHDWEWTAWLCVGQRTRQEGVAAKDEWRAMERVVVMIKTNQVRALAVAIVLWFGGAETLFGQATTGDLDGNHEVSLSDVTGFVGCLTGPESPSVDPLCVAGFFDADDDVDLRDVAAFQNRFGFGVGPPRIDRFSPTPGTWIVDDIGLTQVKVGFTEPVVVPDDAVRVWGVGGGTVTGFSTSYDPQTYSLTVTFPQSLRDDRVTVIVDYSIEDLAGNPLDGEIYEPQNAQLPSGNGVNGGQGVFRIHVLQGDANRDGMTDAADLDLIGTSSGSCDGDPGFNPGTDLNSDGCVNDLDAAITTEALGRLLPTGDQVPPLITSITAQSSIYWITVTVRFNETLRIRLLTPFTCFLVDSDGTVITSPIGVASPPLGNAAIYHFPPMESCEGFNINVSNSIADDTGELLDQPVIEVCP